MTSLAAALDAWRAVLGAEHVLTDAPSLEAAQTATFATAQRVPAILRPADREQVRACLRIANAHRVPVYPVSRGRSWGYGSRVPAGDGCALLELARLDRVIDYDESLAYLTVEPGVTFQQAHAYLRERSSPLMLATIGGPPDASLVGNALERGDGLGPYGDTINHVCGLEVVLPTGELINTGMARFPGARAASTHRWGVGPSLDGLFSQSNLGVVTRMTFWLAPRPVYQREFMGCVDEVARLPELVDAMRRLALDGTLRASIYFWNDVKVLSPHVQYPFDAVGGRTPLPEEVLAEIRREAGLGRWNVSSAVYAPDAEMGEAARRRVESVLTPLVDKLRFRDTPREEGEDAPSARNLPMVYWRKTSAPVEPVDPHRDRCGFLWVSCAVPFSGADAAEAGAIATQVTRLLGFEPNLAQIAVSPRTLYLVAAISYDREVPGEDARALACHDALLRELGSAGYLPFRLGIQSMDALPGSHDDSATLRAALKRALDPNGILAPGRYER